ncbi:MAG TPA: hypothetical protein DEP87_01765 [Candidatus Pacebacteria bacterium]|nr:hypothetical protein [Candidatus Paceibacterota bacterium]
MFLTSFQQYFKSQSSQTGELRHRQAGFTIVELLVVATIIIILTTIGIVSYSQALMNSRNGKRKADLESVRQALILYKADNGYYPSATWATLLTTMGTTYISALPTDPKTGYTYTYSGGSCTGASPVKCQAFTLGANLETTSGTTAYAITNP